MERNKPQLIYDQRGKLFVGGLSWNTTQETLRRYFSKFGVVCNCVVMKNRESGRSRGFGFVNFADPSIIDHVLQNGPHILDGRKIDPKAYTSRSMPKRTDVFDVFLGGLPLNATETDLQSFFGRYGKVTEVVIKYDWEKKKSRGFGFLRFENTEAVDKCCADNFVDLNGKWVEVKRVENRQENNSIAGMSPGSITPQAPSGRGSMYSAALQDVYRPCSSTDEKLGDSDFDGSQSITGNVAEFKKFLLDRISIFGDGNDYENFMNTFIEDISTNCFWGQTLMLWSLLLINLLRWCTTKNETTLDERWLHKVDVAASYIKLLRPITRNDLRKMGIDKLGHQRIILDVRDEIIKKETQVSSIDERMNEIEANLENMRKKMAIIESAVNNENKLVKGIVDSLSIFHDNDLGLEDILESESYASGTESVLSED